MCYFYSNFLIKFAKYFYWYFTNIIPTNSDEICAGLLAMFHLEMNKRNKIKKRKEKIRRYYISNS